MRDAGQVHNLNCTSNLAEMRFDGTCYRCKQIRIVVFLRRKSNGGSDAEAAVALEKAEAIRRQFRLTRGEIFDRQYETVPTKVEDSPSVRPTPQPEVFNYTFNYNRRNGRAFSPNPAQSVPRNPNSWFHTAPLKRGTMPKQTVRSKRAAAVKDLF